MLIKMQSHKWMRSFLIHFFRMCVCVRIKTPKVWFNRRMRRDDKAYQMSGNIE